MSKKKLPDNEIVLYTAPGGDVNIDVLFENDNLWLPQRRMTELFDCTADNISLHLKNIYAEHELDETAVEWFYGKPLQSKYFTQKAIIEYIEVHYNRQRLYSTLGYLPPCQFEANYPFSRFHLFV